MRSTMQGNRSEGWLDTAVHSLRYIELNPILLILYCIWSRLICICALAGSQFRLVNRSSVWS